MSRRRSTALTDSDMAWQSGAFCATARIFDPDIGKTRRCTGDDFFFEARWVPNSEPYRDHVARLRMICGKCPVILECREYADDTDTRIGFWGGETAAERHNRRFPPENRRSEPSPPMLAPCRVSDETKVGRL
jgi:hypothetical protein